jgi:hypothetical protein
VGTAEERFRVLYDRSYSKVLGYALRRADSRDDAFDVVAETFLVAWRRLGDVPEGRGTAVAVRHVIRPSLPVRHFTVLVGTAAARVTTIYQRAHRRINRLTGPPIGPLPAPWRVCAVAASSWQRP